MWLAWSLLFVFLFLLLLLVFSALGVSSFMRFAQPPLLLEGGRKSGYRGRWLWMRLRWWWRVEGVVEGVEGVGGYRGGGGGGGQVAVEG